MKTLHTFFGIFSVATGLFAVSASQAATPGIDGTNATQTSSNWPEFSIGGIQNRATTQRDWLMALPAAHCATRSDCAVRLTWKGGAGGSSSAIAYAVNANGVHTSATTEKFQNSTLAQQKLGDLSVPSNGFVLVVAKLASASSSGATDGGAVTTAELN
jgi:hypothetical protein